MSLTLDVSKLSRWLNADAPSDADSNRRRATEERTLNMYCMVVTLEVSTLSGWLSAFALCRESKGGNTALGEVRAGRREAEGLASSVGGASSVQGRGLNCSLGAGHGEERT